MFGIGFETPSSKDFNKYELILKDIGSDIRKNNNLDYFKIITDNLGNHIGLLNKINYRYIIFKDYLGNNILKQKIIKNIEMLKKRKK